MDNEIIYHPKIKQELSELFMPFFENESGKKNLLTSDEIKDGIEKVLQKVTFSGPSYFFVAELPALRFYYFSKNTENMIGSKPEDIIASNGDLFFKSFDGDFSLMNQITSKIFESFHKISLGLRKESCINLYYNAKNVATEKKLSVVQQNFPLTFDENGFLKGYMGIVTDISFYSRLAQPKATIISTKTGEIVSEITSSSLEENKLSKRELEILKLIANGMDNREVAKELSISYHTVRTHRKNILKKTKISTLEDVIYYLKNSL